MTRSTNLRSPILALLALLPLPAFAQAPDTAAVLALPRDLSPWGMFLNADIVVKAVMVGLVAASVLSWAAASSGSVSRPHVMVPSPRRETERPVEPRDRCCMAKRYPEAKRARSSPRRRDGVR